LEISSISGEITPDISEYGKTTILDDDIALGVHVFNLLLNREGFSYPNFPTFNFDISKFKFYTTNDLPEINEKISSVINKFFGSISNTKVESEVVTISEKNVLYVRIFGTLDAVRTMMPDQNKLTYAAKPVDIIFVLEKHMNGKIFKKILTK